MIETILEEIKEHIIDSQPNEACGLAVLRKGRVRYFPCENHAENPINDFVIDPKEYRDVAAEGDIIGVIHSHNDYLPITPSPLDIAACDRLGVDWYIFNLNGEYKKLRSSNEKMDLIGRPFVFGAYDCFTIIKDYFTELDINISDYQYEWNFWEKGKNLYMENYLNEDFEQVTDGSLKIHDVILMALNSEITNHAGIYVGNNRILHHAPNRLSCRDNYAGIWQQITRIVLRHKNYR